MASVSHPRRPATPANRTQARVQKQVPEPLLERARMSLRLRALDLRDRLGGRSDRLVPPRRLDFVGHSDFVDTGDEFLGHFKDLAALGRDERVLDVGCGIGRMARPLVGYLGPQGSYDGFDVNREGIAWCRERYAGAPQLPLPGRRPPQPPLQPRGHAVRRHLCLPLRRRVVRPRDLHLRAHAPARGGGRPLRRRDRARPGPARARARHLVPARRRLARARSPPGAPACRSSTRAARWPSSPTRCPRRPWPMTRPGSPMRTAATASRWRPCTRAPGAATTTAPRSRTS